MKIVFIGNNRYHLAPFDLQYLNDVATSIKYFSYTTHENIKNLYDLIDIDNTDILIIEDFWEKDAIIISNMILFLEKIRLKKNINILLIDMYYPSIKHEINDEIIRRKNVTLMTDFSLNTFENSIEIPLLACLNFDSHHIINYQGNPDMKRFIMFHNPDFTQRAYDVMYTAGKPTTIRLLINLLLLKHKLNNTYTNISFSQEHSVVNYDTILGLLNSSGLDMLEEKFGLIEEAKNLNFESYLGSLYVQNQKNFHFDSKADSTVDFNSYAQIYTESLTNYLNVVNQYPEIVAFTEKTFNVFFDFKIPLPVDTTTNINYLKKLGFKFPIEPCYIEPTDTLDTMYQKINKWILGLKKYDFKELWNEWMFNTPSDINGFDSPLHENHKLISKFMQTVDNDTGNFSSKPQYIATYKFLQKFFPHFLENYTKWDYQTFLYLKNKKLI